MVNNIVLEKSLPREHWGEFFDQFSNGNRGRHISIEITSSELGDVKPIQNTPLMAIVYVGGASSRNETLREQNENHPGKGDDLVIEVGKTKVFYAHTIDAPTEVLMGQSSSGQIVALWIGDAAGTKTLVKLQAS
jgi:hypothetical protein